MMREILSSFLSFFLSLGTKIQGFWRVQEWASSIFAAPGTLGNLPVDKPMLLLQLGLPFCYFCWAYEKNPPKPLLNAIQMDLTNFKMRKNPNVGIGGVGLI